MPPLTKIDKTAPIQETMRAEIPLHQNTPLFRDILAEALEPGIDKWKVLRAGQNGVRLYERKNGEVIKEYSFLDETGIQRQCYVLLPRTLEESRNYPTTPNEWV